MGTVIDPYAPASGYLSGWKNFSVSTMAVVTLRGKVPGFTVPNFKEEAAGIYADVGSALAAADEAELRKLTTPSCFATMASSFRKRPPGQRQKWTTLEAVASVVQVRVGHHASMPGRQFAQVTCKVDAKLVWTIQDKKGVTVGGLGSKDEPHQMRDFWVFERCIAEPPEPPRWRLKERIAQPKEGGAEAG